MWVKNAMNSKFVATQEDLKPQRIFKAGLRAEALIERDKGNKV